MKKQGWKNPKGKDKKKMREKKPRKVSSLRGKMQEEPRRSKERRYERWPEM